MVSLGALKEQLLKVREGMRISYVVDAAISESNQRKIVDLARGSDLFFCEAPFLDRDRELAAVRRHLTAAHAGKLARKAGVKGFVPFHFSPRYRSTPHVLMEEALMEATRERTDIELCHANTN
jgi:ribonuclease Z